MANTYNYKTTYAKEYQEILYRQPVYRAISREAIAPKLKEGQTLSRSYISNWAVNEMSSVGGYTPQDFTATAETLTVDQKPEVSSRIVKWQDLLDDLPTQKEVANEGMSRLFNYIDGKILGTAVAGANGSLDNASFSGSANDGITVTSSNIAQIFALAQTQLIKQNALSGRYSPIKKFSGVKSRDTGDRMPVAIINAEAYAQLMLFLGSRYTPQGDRVVTNGFVDYLLGFNVFVSNNLRWSGEFAAASNLSNGDTLTIGGLTLKGVTGTPTDAGDFKIEAAAADTITNIKNQLNSPYTSISGKHVAWTQTSLSAAIQTMLKSLTATSSTTTLTVTINGNSNVVVSESSDGAWTAARQICHAYFGTSQACDVAILRAPIVEDPIPVSQSVAKDLVVWSLFGLKVFHDQSPRIVDVKFNTSAITAAPAY